MKEEEEVRDEVKDALEKVERHVLALEAKFGLISEELLKEKLKEFLEKELKLKIEKQTYHDGRGYVFGYPCEVEINVTTYDGKLTLVDFSPYVKAPEVYALKRKAEFYEKRTGKRPEMLLIVAPYVDEKAVKIAKEQGVEVYTKV